MFWERAYRLGHLILLAGILGALNDEALFAALAIGGAAVGILAIIAHVDAPQRGDEVR